MDPNVGNKILYYPAKSSQNLFNETCNRIAEMLAMTSNDPSWKRLDQIILKPDGGFELHHTKGNYEKTVSLHRPLG